MFGEQHSDADCLKSHQPIQAFVRKCVCLCAYVCVCLGAFTHLHSARSAHTFPSPPRSEGKS